MNKNNAATSYATALLWPSLMVSVVAAQVADGPTVAPGPSPSNQASQRPAASFEARYGVLRERNLFLRERSRPRSGSTAAPPVASAQTAPPERNFVLRGVVLEDADLRAYVEDATAGGRLVRLAPGDAVARGHVMEIELDAIRYERDGTATWVEIGHDLSGTRAPTVAPAVRPATAPIAPTVAAQGLPTPPTASPPAVPAGGASESAVEERMRLRRLQSMGGDR